MDGDGRLDILTGSDNCCDSEPGFFWFRKGPDGRWSRMPKVRVDVGDRSVHHPAFFMYRVRVALGDWDGDGLPDLFGWHSQIRGLFLAQSPRRLDADLAARRPLFDLDGWALTRPCPVDWDRDGRVDVLIGSSRQVDDRGRQRTYVSWVPNGPEGGPARPVDLLSLEEVDQLQGIDAADYDGDGWPDLFVGVFSRIEGRPNDRDAVFRQDVRVYPRAGATAARP